MITKFKWLPELLFTPVTGTIFEFWPWARGVAGLTRLPVTEEIAGSNPVGPAIETGNRLLGRFFVSVVPQQFEPGIA